MSDHWYRTLLLCKETGSCNCFTTANQPNEEKEEDTNHQVVVSDTMQLVQDKQEVTETTAGEKNIAYFETVLLVARLLRRGLMVSRILAIVSHL